MFAILKHLPNSIKYRSKTKKKYEPGDRIAFSENWFMVCNLRALSLELAFVLVGSLPLLDIQKTQMFLELC